MLKLLFILFALRVESLLSRYEKHFIQTQHSLDKMIIAENGPLLHDADEIEKQSPGGVL